MVRLAYAVVLMLVSGCGGFRGGIESVPYVGAAQAGEHTSHPSWPHEIALPDVTLRLSLNNAVQTYRYEVMLYVIPTYVNLWEEFRNRDAEALELSLQVIARASSLTFDPRELVLTMDGRDLRPSGVWVSNLERERQVLDAFVRARRRSDPPPPVPRATEWRDAVKSPVTLRSGEASPRFIVTYPVPLVSPEKDLSLDVAPAIVGTAPSGLPRIHFKPTRWSEGYS